MIKEPVLDFVLQAISPMSIIYVHIIPISPCTDHVYLTRFSLN